jgi:hypothetical protein
MRRIFRALAWAALVAAPGLAAGQEPCRPGPMPPALEGAGLSADSWPEGETIRFSATPSRDRDAYAMQIARAGEGKGDAKVRLVKLERQWACNRYDPAGEWVFPLSDSEAAEFFEAVAELEDRWREEKEITVDGTSFVFEHRRGDRIVRLRLSNSATGQSGQLSALILALAGRIARGSVPDTPDWRQR